MAWSRYRSWLEGLQINTRGAGCSLELCAVDVECGRLVGFNKMADTRTSLISHVVEDDRTTTDSSAGVSMHLVRKHTDNTGAKADCGLPGTGTRAREVQRTLLLNSRYLMAALLQQLEGGLGVATTALSDDLHTLIEGKLAEAGRVPLHTQVVLRQEERETHMSLRGERGVFQEIDSPEPDDPHESSRRERGVPGV